MAKVFSNLSSLLVPTKRVCLDNNKCAPSFLKSLCEIGGDCFGLRYFSEETQLPKKNTEVQNNHRRIHTMAELRSVVKDTKSNTKYFTKSISIHSDYQSVHFW